MVDGSGIVTIGTSSSTGITVGMLGITATFPGTVTITGSTTTLQNLVVSGTCTGCGVGNFTAGGDLSGSSTSQTVIGLQGKPVSTTTPLTNQVLTWNGTFWTPTNVSSTGGISSINGLSNATTSIVGAGTVTVSTSSPNTITITGTGSGAIAINSLATSTFQIQGTANQITVATSSPNIISLSLPQNIGTTSIPTFGGLFLNGNATTTGNLVVLGSLLDAGGNPYVTSTSVGASSSTNSLNYLAPASSSVSRTLTSKLGDIVSVKDFGAVGDGVTDDYAALVAAGTAAHAIGGCVYFPAAVYAFGTPISITGNDDNTCWISNNATLKYIGVATSSAFTFNGSISSNGTRIYISNLTLNGGLARTKSNLPVASCGSS